MIKSKSIDRINNLVHETGIITPEIIDSTINLVKSVTSNVANSQVSIDSISSILKLESLTKSLTAITREFKVSNYSEIKSNFKNVTIDGKTLICVDPGQLFSYKDNSKVKKLDAQLKSEKSRIKDAFIRQLNGDQPIPGDKQCLSNGLPTVSKTSPKVFLK